MNDSTIVKNVKKITRTVLSELVSRARSFKHAFAGMGIVFFSQTNAKIHVFAAVAVCWAGFYFGLSSSEWCWTVMAIVMVWCAEALNTAIELLADAAVPQKHPLVKQAKDVAAGAVLMAALGAVVIGILIFGPHL